MKNVKYFAVAMLFAVLAVSPVFAEDGCDISVQFLSEPHALMLDYQSDGIITTVKTDLLETRETFIHILVSALETRLFGNELPSVATSHFVDDIDTSSFEEDIRKAEEIGIISTSKTSFRPKDQLSRAEALTFTVRAYEFYFGNEIPFSSAADAFLDVDAANWSWFYETAQKGSAIELTTGYPNADKTGKCFAPANKVPRHEGIFFVEKLIVLLKEIPVDDEDDSSSVHCVIQNPQYLCLNYWEEYSSGTLTKTTPEGSKYFPTDYYFPVDGGATVKHTFKLYNSEPNGAVAHKLAIADKDKDTIVVVSQPTFSVPYTESQNAVIE